MTEKKVLLITGASRGMGVDIAKAALAAGYLVVATGRDPVRVAQAVGASEDLLTVALDVTDPAGAQAAVRAAVDRFGGIDVLVNNAGNFIAGFFEEITPRGFPGPGRDELVHPGVDQLRRAEHRRLPRAHQGDRGRVERRQRVAER